MSEITSYRSSGTKVSLTQSIAVKTMALEEMHSKIKQAIVTVVSRAGNGGHYGVA
jgi:hypothetical protein